MKIQHKALSITDKDQSGIIFIVGVLIILLQVAYHLTIGCKVL